MTKQMSNLPGKAASVAKPRGKVQEDPLKPVRNKRQWVAVAYDIPDDKRRRKVMKMLAGYGRWAQYSVFECEVRPADLERMVQRLRKLIRAELDDVRIYPLCETCLGKTIMLGKAEMHRHASITIV